MLVYLIKRCQIFRLCKVDPVRLTAVIVHIGKDSLMIHRKMGLQDVHSSKIRWTPLIPGNVCGGSRKMIGRRWNQVNLKGLIAPSPKFLDLAAFNASTGDAFGTSTWTLLKVCE